MIERKNSISENSFNDDQEYSVNGYDPASETEIASDSEARSRSSSDSISESDSKENLQNEKLFKQFERNFITIGADVGKLFKTSLERKGKIDLDSVELQQTMNFNLDTRIPSVDKDISKEVKDIDTINRINEVKGSVINDIRVACSGTDLKQNIQESQNKLLNLSLAGELAEKSVSYCQLEQKVLTKDLNADFMPKKAELVSKLTEKLNKIDLFKNPIFSIRSNTDGQKLDSVDYKFGVVSQNPEFIKEVGNLISAALENKTGNLGDKFASLSDRDIAKIAEVASKKYNELVTKKDFYKEKLDKSAKAVNKRIKKEEQRLNKSEEKFHEIKLDEIIDKTFNKIKDQLPKDSLSIDEEQKQKLDILKDNLRKIDPKTLRDSKDDLVNYLASEVGKKINSKKDGKFHLDTNTINKLSKIDLYENMQKNLKGPLPIAVPEPTLENGIISDAIPKKVEAEIIITEVDIDKDEVLIERNELNSTKDKSSHIITHIQEEKEDLEVEIVNQGFKSIPEVNKLDDNKEIIVTEVNEDGDIHFSRLENPELSLKEELVDNDKLDPLISQKESSQQKTNKSEQQNKEVEKKGIIAKIREFFKKIVESLGFSKSNKENIDKTKNEIKDPNKDEVKENKQSKQKTKEAIKAEELANQMRSGLNKNQTLAVNVHMSVNTVTAISKSDKGKETSR